MKTALSALALFSVLISAPARAASLEVPRQLQPAVALETASVNALLISLVEEYEELSTKKDDLIVYLSNEDGMPCELENEAKLVCKVAYNQDRWNGVMHAEFAVSEGQLVTLTSAKFTGNF